MARAKKPRPKPIPRSKTKLSAPAIVSPYLTTAEAAAYLKVSRQYLESSRYRADGTGPDYVRLGRSVRYVQATLDAWMLANVRSANEPIR
jgi:predicted DNA-binding transcriptional regulator AlpA